MPVTMRGGKVYATVQERLSAAHDDDPQPKGIASIRTQVQSAGMGAHTVVTATVEFKDGRTFTGMSLARFDATSGADATSPVECAETSAVGRALAFAGYFGSDDGLAGAEEVRDAQRFGPVPKPFSEVLQSGASQASPTRRPSVAVRGAQKVDEDAGRTPPPPGARWPHNGEAAPDVEAMSRLPATERQREFLAKLGARPEDAPAGLTRQQASELISDLAARKKGGG